MRVKDGERGREKEGKLDGVEKRGLGRCFSVHPLLPPFSLASILSMLFLFLALLSLSLSLLLFSPIQNTSIYGEGFFES